MTDSVLPPPGWHPDPGGTPQLRWWDGQRWTDHLADQPSFPPTATRPSAAATRTIWPWILGGVIAVVFLGGVCTAIAIPTFIGARDRAQDLAAQSSVRAVTSSALAAFADGSLSEDVTTNRVRAANTNLSITTANSTGPRIVSIDVRVEQFVASARSDSGTCFSARVSVGEALGYRISESFLCAAGIEAAWPFEASWPD